jgi:hypothetical protein
MHLAHAPPLGRRTIRNRSRVLIGAGMGLPGPTRDDGVVDSSAILPDWLGVPAMAEAASAPRAT